MRGFLLLLVLAAPIALANPIFWWLVQSAYSAAPATYVEADGQLRPALLGPQSPWPDWALVPDGAKLTVEAWFAAAPPTPETGFGTLKLPVDSAKAVRAFVAKLETAGWQVETSEIQTVDPTIPPKPFQLCTLRATRRDGGPRVMSASIPLGYSGITPRLHWWSTPPPQLATWPALTGPRC